MFKRYMTRVAVLVALVVGLVFIPAAAAVADGGGGSTSIGGDLFTP